MQRGSVDPRTSKRKTNSLHSKAYFHVPGCQDYYKVKYENYEKVRKLRSKKQLGKQNVPILYQFEKPRSGYYAMMGCKNINMNEQIPQTRKSASNGQMFSNFLHKFIARKQRVVNLEETEPSLPNIKSVQYSKSNLSKRPLHMKSLFIDTHIQVQKKRNKKLKTQPDTVDEVRQIKTVKGSLPITLNKQKIKSQKVLHKKSLSPQKDTI